MASNKAIVQTRLKNANPIQILMADPDVSFGAVYQGPLLQEGFALTMAANGLECVARLREGTLDALVLEPQLPWGGGDGILAVMGDIPELANVPILVLTACHEPRLLDAVSRFPVSDFQIKPLTPSRLAARLHAILAHPNLRFTLAEQNGRLECSIVRRTDGRLHDLRVETAHGRVIVHGRCDSHYVKQLALAAVQEAFEASQSESKRIVLDIDVATEGGWLARHGKLSKTRGNEPLDEFIPNEELALTNESNFIREN